MQSGAPLPTHTTATPCVACAEPELYKNTKELCWHTEVPSAALVLTPSQEQCLLLDAAALPRYLVASQAAAPLVLPADTPLAAADTPLADAPHSGYSARARKAMANEHRDANEERGRAEPSWKLAKVDLSPNS